MTILKPIKIRSEWMDDLIWCPSQCYLNIEFNKKYFVIYLRWRHSDPWNTPLLIECKDENFHTWDEDDRAEYKLDSIPRFNQDQLPELKKASIKAATKLLNEKYG